MYVKSNVKVVCQSIVVVKSQSTFVQGRNIIDGILIANEVVDEPKNKKK